MKLIKFVHDELGFPDRVRTLVDQRKADKQAVIRAKVN